MKLQQLLQNRSLLLRQTRLANVAYVFAELSRYAERVSIAGLQGRATLYPADAQAQRAWPVLLAEEGSQAVLDEHFLDVDVLDLADLLAFASGADPLRPQSFRWEEFGPVFLAPLRRELASAGIELPADNVLSERDQDS